ncbi:MAG: hypothetical protein IE931_03280 [Sphingobacteriales bacterium]|nr:hypothetical protein [Sphingobacteriales bacterium]
MSVKRPDRYEHNNPNEPIVLSQDVKGGSLKTADLTTLLTDFTGKENKLIEGVTKVYVASEAADYRLINIAALDSLASWQKVLESAGGGASSFADLNGLARDNSSLLSELTNLETADADEASARITADNALSNALDLKADLVGGLVPSYQLPSFVDDVIEGYLNAGSFYQEDTFTTLINPLVGKIYVDLTAGQENRQYRYSGSSYIQITNGLIASTDDVPEGSNLYFTVARVLATTLSGLSALVGGPVVSTDSILIAFGKIQNQLNNKPDNDGTGASGTWAIDIIGNAATATEPNNVSEFQAALGLGNNAYIDKELPINNQTASYTLVLADNNKVVETNVATANNLTIPANSSVPFPVGTQIIVHQLGAGQTTFVAGSGVTIRQRQGFTKTAGKYALCSLIKRATDEWLLGGDLA